MNNGRLEPRWFKGASLPTSLADILEKVGNEEDDVSEDSESDDEYNIDSGQSDSDNSDTD